MTIERISDTEVQVSTFIDNLAGFPQPEVDGDPVIVSTVEPPVADSFTFDMLGFQGGGGTWGTSNVPFTPDNGLDFMSIQVETNVGGGDLVGDFNGDGVIDCADADGYVGNIDAAATGALAALDIDGDGTLSSGDAETLITTLVVTSNGVTGTFLGDLNCDGQVNVLGDAIALVPNLGQAVMAYGAGDITLDGTVNVLGDALILVGNLGSSND